MSPSRTIDLNCDMGEFTDAARIAIDLALLGIVTSANIACGGHAGDEATMSETVRAAMELGVAVGAHPGYPDRARFGRVEIEMPPRAIEESVTKQILALMAVADRLGAPVGHVKPHGALYHTAMKKPDVAQAIARAVQRTLPKAILVGQAGNPMLDRWRSMGMRVAAEAFADRRYELDGALRSRTLPGALIEAPAEAAAQALRIARGEGVLTAGGAVLPIRADTTCIHSDTPGSVAIAGAVRDALRRAGITIGPPRSG